MKTLRKIMMVPVVMLGVMLFAQPRVASAHSAYAPAGFVAPVAVKPVAQQLQGGFPAGGGKPAPTPTPRPKPVGPPKSGDE